MRKEILICDGIKDRACGTVLVNENDGILLTGAMQDCTLGAGQVMLIGDLPRHDLAAAPCTKERAICATCLAELLGPILHTAVHK